MEGKYILLTLFAILTCLMDIEDYAALVIDNGYDTRLLYNPHLKVVEN